MLISSCITGDNSRGSCSMMKRRWIHRVGDFACRDKGDVNMMFRKWSSEAGVMCRFRIRRFLGKNAMEAYLVFTAVKCSGSKRSIALVRHCSRPAVVSFTLSIFRLSCWRIPKFEPTRDRISKNSCLACRYTLTSAFLGIPMTPSTRKKGVNSGAIPFCNESTIIGNSRISICSLY